MAGLTGVFGGTFDPPHYGHLILAESGRNALGLDTVLWVVTARPPHKAAEPQSPVEVRLAMVEAAIADNAGFALSRADIDRPGPHYATGTMQWLHRTRPGEQFAYLMGEDSLRDLHSWHEPRAFVEGCAVIGVMERSGVEPDLRELEEVVPGLSAKVRFFRAPLIDIASKDLRRRVAGGESIRYLVPPEVARIIQAHGLYR